MSARILNLRPIVMADKMTPADKGPYFVGYGDDWQEFTEWDDAWLHHAMRGSTLGASHIRVRAAGTPSEDRRKELSEQLRSGNDASGPTGRAAGTYIPADTPSEDTE